MIETATTQHAQSFFAAARDRITARRAAARSRQRLADELAIFTTDADRNDLNAMLDTYPDAEVADVRDILNRRVAA